MIHSDYLETLFNRDAFSAAIRHAMDDLSGVSFDAIAVSGNSGTIFGGALAVAMNKHLFLVRKPGVDSHGFRRVEGNDQATTYVFVDDCIASGATRDMVKAHMSASFPQVAYCGTYTYRSDCPRRGFSVPSQEGKSPAGNLV